MKTLTVLNFPSLPECKTCTYRQRAGEQIRKCPICETTYNCHIGEHVSCPKGHSYWQQMEALGYAKLGGKS